MVAATVNLFSIELENPTQTFTPGSKICGKVRVSTTSILKTSKITLHAFGRAHIIFSLISDEVYFSFESMLWHGIKHELPPGHYEFPFVFILPSTCPPSFDGGFGSIKYSITADIHVPWWFNKHVSINFKVAPKIELNLMPILSKPNTIIDKRKAWFSNKNLRAMVNINKRVFSRYESVKVSINISNDRPSTVKFIETGILSVVQIAKPSLSGVYSFDVLSCLSHFSSEKVNIPELCRSHHSRNIPTIRCLPTIRSSSLFQIRHFVYVKLRCSGWFNCPLVITSQIVINDNIAQEIQPSPTSARIYPNLSTASGNSLAAIANGISFESDVTQLIEKTD